MNENPIDNLGNTPPPTGLDVPLTNEHAVAGSVVLAEAGAAMQAATPAAAEAMKSAQSVEIARHIYRVQIAREHPPTLAGRLEVRVPRLIRACTPSVLLDQPFVSNPLASDISVSWGELGNPAKGSKVFGGINETIAQLYGAERAWALVNGSTGANWTVARMLRRRLDDDQLVLVGRGSHISVPQSLTDFGVRWAYIEPDYLDDYEAILPPSPDRVRKAVDQAESAGVGVGAVWVNGPSYEGVALDTAGIHAALGGDERTIPLIVDEAWGSHFAALDALASWSAVGNGADLVNTSTHKQAGGLQGTAVLVLPQNSRLPAHEVDASVRSMYSTSPSFLLLASIESTYRQLLADRQETGGATHIGRLVGLSERLRTRLQQACHDTPVSLFDEDPTVTSHQCVEHIDPLKVTLGLRSIVPTGFMLADKLAAMGIIPEKEGHNTLTLLVTHQMNQDDIDRVATRTAAAIDELGGARPQARAVLENPFSLAAGPQVFEPREAARRACNDGQRIKISEAAGRIAGERIAAYPPGVPIFVEGQRISSEHVQFILNVTAGGGHLHVGDAPRPGEADEEFVTVLPEPPPAT